MKSTCTVKEPENQFPCLMIHADKKYIVLFIDSCMGVVVYDPLEKYQHLIGSYYSDYNINSFRPFYGSITLSN